MGGQSFATCVRLLSCVIRRLLESKEVKNFSVLDERRLQFQDDKDGAKKYIMPCDAILIMACCNGSMSLKTFAKMQVFI